MNLAQVRFDIINQTILCSYDKLHLKINLTVIVDTDSNGLMFGKVISLLNGKNVANVTSFSKIVRISTKKDYLQHLSNLKDAKKAIDECKKMILNYELNMNILDGFYNFDRSQLMFRFISEERVDFRKLARDMGAIFKTRIELRQVGIRDKAKEVGGFGPCGRMLCCSTFLKSFDSVSISMAKNQALSLNPTKINGVCGRLLCCLKYENDMYTDLKKEMPAIGSMVKIFDENGKVISINPFTQKYKVMLEDKRVIEVESDGSKK